MLQFFSGKRMAFQINVHKIGVLLSADGYITFEASDKKGNAVIAAKDGVWQQAFGASYGDRELYDKTLAGINFSRKFGDDTTIWYPSSNYRSDYGGGLWAESIDGIYWSVTSYVGEACCLAFTQFPSIKIGALNGRANGYSVRCLQSNRLSYGCKSIKYVDGLR